MSGHNQPTGFLSAGGSRVHPADRPAKESSLNYSSLVTISRRAFCLQAAPVFILLTDLPGPQAEQRLSTAQKLMQAASLFHLSHHTAGHITQVAFLPELHFQQVGCFSLQGPMEPSSTFPAATFPLTTRQHAPAWCAVHSVHSHHQGHHTSGPLLCKLGWCASLSGRPLLWRS